MMVTLFNVSPTYETTALLIKMHDNPAYVATK